MNRLLLILPLALASCAPIRCERVWLDPVTGLYGCERPTSSLVTGPRREGAEPHDPPVVDHPTPDLEPDRQTDPEGWHDWRERTPRRG